MLAESYRAYCTKCKKDVTEDIVLEMDSRELGDGLVWMRSCPGCKSLENIRWIDTTKEQMPKDGE